MNTHLSQEGLMQTLAPDGKAVRGAHTQLSHEGLMQTLAPDGKAVRGAHTQLRLIHEGPMQTAQLRKRLPLVARRQDGSYE